MNTQTNAMYYFIYLLLLLGFSAGEFRNLLTDVMPFTIFMGAASLSINILIAFYR